MLVERNQNQQQFRTALALQQLQPGRLLRSAEAGCQSSPERPTFVGIGRIVRMIFYYTVLENRGNISVRLVEYQAAGRQADEVADPLEHVNSCFLIKVAKVASLVPTVSSKGTVSQLGTPSSGEEYEQARDR